MIDLLCTCGEPLGGWDEAAERLATDGYHEVARLGEHECYEERVARISGDLDTIASELRLVGRPHDAGLVEAVSDRLRLGEA